LVIFVQYPSVNDSQSSVGAISSISSTQSVTAPISPASNRNEDLSLSLQADQATLEQMEINRIKPKEDVLLINSEKHFILGLSDYDFDAKTVSEMIERYGEADGGGSCANDFGNSLVQRWRDKRKSYCARNSRIDAQTASNIDCFLVRQTRHHGNGDNLCVMENVKMDMSIFANQKVTNETVINYVKSDHWKQPYINFEKGFISGNCDIQPTYWKNDNFPGWNEDVVFKAFDNTGTDLNCDSWVEHPVLIVQRDTFANFFHGSEDMVNAFLAMAILQWPAGDTQVI
jgi:hypothetical protein